MSEVLVIGAGPAGCVAASHLANLGYSVTVVEKTKFPRFTIGESLLPISMEHFEETGLLSALKEANFEIKTGAWFIRGEDEIDISFDENFTPGWTWTWQVPRDEFDSILANETEKKGVKFLYESELSKIEFFPEAVQASILCSGGGTIMESFKYVIDSSGNAGVLSRLLSLKKDFAGTGRKAIFTQVKDQRASKFKRPKRIAFEVLENDLWMWVIPFSNGNTSLGFVGDEKWFGSEVEPNEIFKSLLKKSTRFAERFEGLDYLYNVKEVTDYTCNSEILFGDRFVLAGNTTGFIDPVFSSGVALATSSGILAAKLVDKELKGEHVDWQTSYADYLNLSKEVFSSFIDAWYDGDLHKIFFHPNIKMSIKKQMTSILAGYVWDKKNPFVKKKRTLLKTVAKVIDIETATA